VVTAGSLGVCVSVAPAESIVAEELFELVESEGVKVSTVVVTVEEVFVDAL
jgi:hypothetical protein